MAQPEVFTQIENSIRRCRKCRLHRGRNRAVPGSGSVNAPIAFVGEAPGFHEDAQGLPFVGRAGQLLDQLLASIGLTRSEVWIGNVVKCRPPENRNPLVDELRACIPYLNEQLRIIKPRLIVPLGRFALEHFVKGGKISRDHGVPKRIGSFLVYPVYHPAAALRSTQVLNVLEKEFKKIPEILSTDPGEFEEVGAAAVDENQMKFF